MYVHTVAPIAYKGYTPKIGDYFWIIEMILKLQVDAITVAISAQPPTS